MKKNHFEPEIVTIKDPVRAIGLSMKTGMKSIYKDVAVILKRYMMLKEKYGIPNQKKPWEYVSLSKDFKEDQTWNYFTGHVVTAVENIPEEFISFNIPTGTYAVFPIRVKYKLMLGIAIGKTKRYIYNEWLKKSKYEFAGYEFEYNDENMFTKSPNHIDLYVGVKDKE